MKLSNNGAICLLVLLPVFTQAILHSAVCHICDLGKGKTFRKKEKQGLSLSKRILLAGYVENCRHYAVQARRLRAAYWVGLIYLMVCFLCWALSGFFPLAGTLLYYLVCIKVMALDIPVFVFFFFMTKHGKNGGVTWKWEV